MNAKEPCHAEAAIELSLDPQAAWDIVIDWERQSRWMLLTRVWATEQAGVGVGGGVAARTSVGGMGFTDHMVITHWEVVRGTGTFAVAPASGGSTFTWSEDVVPPLGKVGAFGWPVVRPLFEWMMRISLRRLVREVAR